MTPLVVLLAAVALSAGAPAGSEYGNEEPPAPVINIADNEYLIEAELFAKRKGWQDDLSRLPQRSAASNGYAVHLYKSESYTVDFCLPIEQSVWIENIYFSNDGWVDTISVALNGREIGEFLSADESNWGNLWNEFNDTGSIGGELGLPSGRHSLTFTVKDGDEWGVELDAIKMRFSRPDVTVDLFCPGEADNSDGKNKTEGQNYPGLPNTPTQTTNDSFSSTDSSVTNSNQPTSKSPFQTTHPDYNYKTKNPRCRLPWCHHNVNPGHTQPTRSTGLPVNPNYPDDPYCLTLKCKQDAIDSKQTYPPNSGNTKTSDPFYDDKWSPTDKIRSDSTNPTESYETKAPKEQDRTEHSDPSETSFSPYPSGGSTSSRPYNPSSNSPNPSELPIFETTNPAYSSNSNGKYSTEKYGPSDSADHSQQSNKKTTAPSEEFSTDSTTPSSSNQKCSSPGCKDNKSTSTSPTLSSQPADSENDKPHYSTSPLCTLPGCQQSTSSIKTSTESSDSVTVTPINPYYPDDPYCETPECKQSIEESTTPSGPGYPTCTGKGCKDNQGNNKFPSTPSLTTDTPGITKSPDVTSTPPPSNSRCTSPDCKTSPSYSGISQPISGKTESSDNTEIPVTESSTISNILSSGETKLAYTTQTIDPWTVSTTVPDVSTKTENIISNKPTSATAVDPECTSAECKQNTKTSVNPWFSTTNTIENQDITNTDKITDATTIECNSPDCKKSSPKTTFPSDAKTKPTGPTAADPDCKSPGCRHTTGIELTTERYSSKSTNPLTSHSSSPFDKSTSASPSITESNNPTGSDCASPECKRKTSQPYPSPGNTDSIDLWISGNTEATTGGPGPSYPEKTDNRKPSTTDIPYSSEKKDTTNFGSTKPTDPTNNEITKSTSSNTGFECTSPECKQRSSTVPPNSRPTTSSKEPTNQDGSSNPVYTSVSASTSPTNYFSSGITISTDSPLWGSTKPVKLAEPDCTSPECKQNIFKTTSAPDTKPTYTRPTGATGTSYQESQQTDKWNSGSTHNPVSTKTTDTPKSSSTKVSPVDPGCTSADCKQNPSTAKPIDRENFSESTDVNPSKPTVPSITDPWYSTDAKTTDSSISDHPKSTENVFSSPKPTEHASSSPNPTGPNSGSSFDPECTSLECQQNSYDKVSHGTKSTEKIISNPSDNNTPSHAYGSTISSLPDLTKEVNCNTPGCRLSVPTESTNKEQGSSHSSTENATQLPNIQTGGNSPPLTDEVYQISCPTPQLLTVRRNDYLGCADDGKIRFDLYGARVSEVTFVIPTPFRIPNPSLRRLETPKQEKILWEDGFLNDNCDGSENRDYRKKGISQLASDGSLPITINPSVTPSLTLSFRLSTTGVDLSKHLRPVFTMGVCCTDPANISMTAVETDTNTVIQLGEQLFHDKDNLKSWIFPFISGLDDRNIKVKINFNDVTERLVLNYMKFEIQEVDKKVHDAPTAPPTTVLCETKDVKVEGVKHEDPNKKKLKFRLNGSSTTSDVSSLLFKSPQTSDPKLILDSSGRCSFNPLSSVNVDDSAAFILGATDPNSNNPNLAIEEVELEPDVNEVDNTSVILHLLGSTFGRTSLKLKISEKETTLTLLQLVPFGKPLSSFFLPCGNEQTTIKADETDAISINDPWKSITGEQLTIRRR